MSSGNYLQFLEVMTEMLFSFARYLVQLQSAPLFADVQKYNMIDDWTVN